MENEDIREQLARITGSEAFTAGIRVRKFLEHVVAEELAGRGDLLKGTALAMDLFGRDADFDPGSDPIVRTEAVKLRKALEHYYLTEGASDPLVIAVPKGTYRPTFELREIATAPQEIPAAPGLPVLSIAPFTGPDSATAHLYREGLPAEIALELARFDHIRVRSIVDEGAGIQIPMGYLLRGQVQEAVGQMRVVLQLLRHPSGDVIWSDRLRIDPDDPDVFALQEKIARACATNMADAYGALSEDVGARFHGRGTEDAGVFEALLAFHSHMRTSRQDSLDEFAELARMALQDNPDSGLAHALVVHSMIEAIALGQSDVSTLVAEARHLAEKAVALAPQCQEALFAAAVLALLQEDRQRFDILLNQAVRANPNGALMTAMAGAWIAMAGDLNRGVDLVRHALEANPMLPVWTRIPLALGAIGAGDFEEASRLVSDIDVRDVAGEWIIIAAAHGLARNQSAAGRAIRRLEELQVDPEVFVTELPLEAGLASQLQKGLRAAKPS